MDVEQGTAKTKKRTQYKGYGTTAMEKAIAAVENDGKTVYRAAKDCGVPMNTLRDRLIAKNGVKPNGPARQKEADGNTASKQSAGKSEQGSKADVILEDDVIERWHNIGMTEGLNSNADIVGFLVSLYYKGDKQDENKTDIRCHSCHNPLTLVCVHCQVVSPPHIARPSSAADPANQSAETSVVISNGGSEERLVQNEPQEIISLSPVKVEESSAATETRPKRSQRLCEKKKQLFEDNKKLTQSSQKKKPSFKEVEVSSDDENVISVLEEANISVDALPNHFENANVGNHQNDVGCSLDDFLKELEEQTKKKTKKQTHGCPQCGETFDDRATLQEHLQTTQHSSLYDCNLCKKTFKKKAAYIQHQRVHKRQAHQCSICGMAFKFPSRLNKHLKTHGSDRQHVCDKCGKSFVSVYYLRDHIKIHSEERRYKCDLCGAAFKQKPALYAHGKKHSKEKLFQCQYCGLKFTHSQKMKIHVRSHTGEKPYQCPMCDARFVSNSNMWQHCAFVHGKSTKVHHCPHCPLTFAAKAKLKLHLKNAHSDAASTTMMKDDVLGGDSDCRNSEIMKAPFYVDLPRSSVVVAQNMYGEGLTC